MSAQPEGARRGRPPTTNRDEIVAAARRILEADGADALSMRRLATELGTAPPVIYRMVGGREELVRAVVEKLIAEMRAIVPRGRTAHARILSVARAIRDEVQQHPYLVEIARQVGQGPATNFPGQVVLARELAAAGLKGAPAAEALRSILYVVGGFVLLEALPPQPAERTSTQDMWRSVDDPALDRELVRRMSRPPDLDAVFTYTLDRLLDSLLSG